MRQALPKALTDTMTEEIAYLAIGREGTIHSLDSYVEQVQQMDQIATAELIVRVVSTAHYTWRTSSSALKLVLDDRVRGHLNVFTRMELAGLGPFVIWGKHLMNLFKPAGINFEYTGSNPDFKSQANWLNEIDCMFPLAIAEGYFQRRREFIESKGLISKRDLYEYVRLPENEIFSFYQTVENKDTSLVLERKNVHQAMYGDSSENMIFRTTRDIISANGGNSPIDW